MAAVGSNQLLSREICGNNNLWHQGKAFTRAAGHRLNSQPSLHEASSKGIPLLHADKLLSKPEFKSNRISWSQLQRPINSVLIALILLIFKYSHELKV